MGGYFRHYAMGLLLIDVHQSDGIGKHSQLFSWSTRQHPQYYPRTRPLSLGKICMAWLRLTNLMPCKIFCFVKNGAIRMRPLITIRMAGEDPAR